METKIGKIIPNANGKNYVILAVNGNSAVVQGGFDYVVIRDLDYFEQSGNWGNGKYFPCFDDKDSYKMLNFALYYMKNYCYPPEDHPLYRELEVEESVDD